MNDIRVSDIFKSYGDKRVLQGISLEIEQGEFFGLIGPNGAGKTTLINIMLGLIEPDSGTVVVDGLQMGKNDLEIKSRIGYVPQELALMEETTVGYNLEYFGVLYNLKVKALKEAIDRVLVFVGLENERKKKVAKLSGGMKRRLNIACATMHRPSILVLDEPTVGIDPQSRNHIFDYLKRLNQEERVTILYTSHYMEEVEALCDRIFILDNGVEVAYGDKEMIRGMVEVGKTIEFETKHAIDGEITRVIGELPGVIGIAVDGVMVTLQTDPLLFQLNALIRHLENHRVDLISVQYRKMSLEQVFLDLTGKSLRG